MADLKENGELPKRVLLRSSKYLNKAKHPPISQIATSIYQSRDFILCQVIWAPALFLSFYSR